MAPSGLSEALSSLVERQVRCAGQEQLSAEAHARLSAGCAPAYCGSKGVAEVLLSRGFSVRSDDVLIFPYHSVDIRIQRKAKSKRHSRHYLIIPQIFPLRQRIAHNYLSDQGDH